jgi:hypothetical protein
METLMPPTSGISTANPTRISSPKLCLKVGFCIMKKALSNKAFNGDFDAPTSEISAANRLPIFYLHYISVS